MSDHVLTTAHLRAYEVYLAREEKSPATRSKYLRDAARFRKYAGEKPVTKELVLAYKKECVDRGYAARSINSMLAAVNGLLRYLGREECCVKTVRYQRQTYCLEERELSRIEYLRLLEVSRKNVRLNLVLQTICGTGIRVSELRYFTVAAVRRGQVTVACKNKTRTIFIPGKLKRRLLDYARTRGIAAGEIFVSRNGNPLDRSNIWSQMKQLCDQAGVRASKVFPHNLRKLFARTFYTIDKDISKLADILGHSSIDTTRIYVMTTGAEHRRKIERLGLVI